MVSTKVESGVCLGFGGTNARRAVCEDGDIKAFTSIETPTQPREFFGWMARQVLQASHDGHEWLVAGYPGPVSPDGKLVGPLANVAGMAQRRYDLREELNAQDSAVGKLLDENFLVLGVNDGNLAAQAAALQFGNNKYEKVSALIVGTGVGAGVVAKDVQREGVYHADNSNPYEVGHMLLGGNPFDTYENRFSGPALERAYGNPRELATGHPAWREVGVGVGRLATTLSLMSGVELVVPTGGVGAGASDKYRPHLESFMDTYHDFGNSPQQLFTPEIAFVDPATSHEFEMFGAPGVVASHMAVSAA